MTKQKTLLFNDWSTEQFEEDFDMFLYELEEYDSRQTNVKNYIINGSLGVWYGRVKIYPAKASTLKEAFLKAIKSANHIEVYDKSGSFNVYAHHHDGTNIFTIYKQENRKKNINFLVC